MSVQSTRCYHYMITNMHSCIYTFKQNSNILQGASKSGTAPDGSSYVEAAEKEEIKALLR